MLEDPTTITRALNLTIVARCLERVADHCKNIAEEVYYLYHAVDIRHDRTSNPVSDVAAVKTAATDD